MRDKQKEYKHGEMGVERIQKSVRGPYEESEIWKTQHEAKTKQKIKGQGRWSAWE